MAPEMNKSSCISGEDLSFVFCPCAHEGGLLNITGATAYELRIKNPEGETLVIPNGPNCYAVLVNPAHFIAILTGAQTKALPVGKPLDAEVHVWFGAAKKIAQIPKLLTVKPCLT